MWNEDFRRRMEAFGDRAAHGPGDSAISIKIRVTSGCFHREHSPVAYSLIDTTLDRVPPPGRSFEFVEHESGPEILVYVAAATAGISLAKSVIDLVVAIFKARSEGIRKGDQPSHPLELIVRRSVDREHVSEEVVLRVEHSDSTEASEVELGVLEALRKLIDHQPGELDVPTDKRLQPTSGAASKKKGKSNRRSGTRGSAASR